MSLFNFNAEANASRLEMIADRILTFLRLRQQSITDLSQELTQFGEHMIRVHIPTQLNVQGTPQRFAPLSRKYAARKARIAPGMPILMLSGRMGTGFSYTVAGNQLSITNERPYTQYHQTGTGKMPARQFIQMEDDDLGYGAWRRIVTTGITEVPL